ncbi:MAG: hypothetical protein GY715_15650 [Planctomycetes bacterium]|nr:hypothetical protein [Planctomycetota bacterium]
MVATITRPKSPSHDSGLRPQSTPKTPGTKVLDRVDEAIGRAPGGERFTQRARQATGE